MTNLWGAQEESPIMLSTYWKNEQFECAPFFLSHFLGLPILFSLTCVKTKKMNDDASYLQHFQNP